MRCYNGAPDSELRALLDMQSKARRELAAHGARPVYYPMERKWMVWQDLTPLTDFCGTLLEAAAAAFRRLETASRNETRKVITEEDIPAAYKAQ